MPGAAGGATTPTMQQAEQAEKAGQYADAIRLYEKAGQEVTNSNHDLAMRCFSRAQCLREGRTGSVPPGYQPGVPAQASTGGDPRFAPIANYTAGSPVAAQLTNQGQAAGYSPPRQTRRYCSRAAWAGSVARASWWTASRHTFWKTARAVRNTT